jgi:hypothetical protein
MVKGTIRGIAARADVNRSTVRFRKHVMSTVAQLSDTAMRILMVTSGGVVLLLGGVVRANGSRHVISATYAPGLPATR